jgi:hypothetical protein
MSSGSSFWHRYDLISDAEHPNAWVYSIHVLLQVVGGSLCPAGVRVAWDRAGAVAIMAAQR